MTTTPNPDGHPGSGDARGSSAAPQPGFPPGPQPDAGPYDAAPYGVAPQGTAPQYPAPGQDGAPQPGARYGTLPYGATPYGAAGQDGTVTEPPQHRRLLALTLASAAAYVLSMLPVLFGFGDVELMIRDAAAQDPTLAPAELDQLIRFLRGTAVASMIVSLLITLGLYALVYFGLRGVGNWARILGIVLAILGVLGAVMSVPAFLTLPGPTGILVSLLSVVLAVVDILWLVNAFSADEAAYTRQGRRVSA